MTRGDAHFVFFKHNAIPSLIIDLSTGEIIDANDAVTYFGYSPEELRGSHFSRLIISLESLQSDSLTPGRYAATVRARSEEELHAKAIVFDVSAPAPARVLLLPYPGSILEDEEPTEVERRFDIYLDFSARVVASSTREEVGQVVDQAVRDTFGGVRGVSLWEVNNDEDIFRVLNPAGASGEFDFQILATRSDFQDLLRTRQIQTFELDADSAPAMQVYIVPADLRRSAAVVLASDRPMPLNEADMRILQAYAAQTALKLERLRLLADNRKASNLLVNLQERERRAISRDVHDHIGGHLNSLRLLLKMMHGEGAEIESDVREALKLVDEVIGQVRDLSFQLSPSILADLGIVPTLHTYSKRFSVRTRIGVRFVCEVPSERRFSWTTETTLFRVVQESLTNVSKYAGPCEVQIHLREEREMVLVHVVDDGTGFDPQELTTAESGTGLRGLRERVELAGGRLEVTSSRGEGTRISAFLPK